MHICQTIATMPGPSSVGANRLNRDNALRALQLQMQQIIAGPSRPYVRQETFEDDEQIPQEDYQMPVASPGTSSSQSVDNSESRKSLQALSSLPVPISQTVADLSGPLQRSNSSREVRPVNSWKSLQTVQDINDDVERRSKLIVLQKEKVTLILMHSHHDLLTLCVARTPLTSYAGHSSRHRAPFRGDPPRGN